MKKTKLKLNNWSPMKSKENTESRLVVAASPHIYSSSLSTRTMMMDVLIALTPVIGMAIYVYGLHAAKQLLICVSVCLLSEFVFVSMRKKALTLTDFSALITGVILGLSIPAPAPWYVGVVASVTAIGIGKILFGGLGMNIFNPAMVGRAFVMIAFASVMAASGYIDTTLSIDTMTMATPLNAFKQAGVTISYPMLIFGKINGSPGEVSSIACIIGGLYLCIRRTAAWQIPAGMLSAVLLLGSLVDLAGLQQGWTVLHHLFSGALLFGAFFIATDPVTSPLTPKGKFIFGAGVGTLVMIIRLFSGYPEGVMFAILLMNSVTPLIDRWVKHKTMGEL
jgi:electron transport complex protein RnfD